MREVKVIKTEDGSNSLFLPELNETYHSFHGALGESMHVFIRMGLDYWKSQHPDRTKLSILEVGFGTGLNGLLALEWAEKNAINITFVTIEPFPLNSLITNQLNFGQIVADAVHDQAFHAMHAAPWGKGSAISSRFNLLKHQCRLEDFSAPGWAFDLVFFDAFAPSKQAELWEKDLLRKVARLMAPAGVFTTYCAKGQLKRDLKSLDLLVETLPGAPGKKEMVRAIKPK